MSRTGKLRAAGPAVALLALLAGSACDEKVVGNVDTTPPEASITSPADGSTVSGVSFLLEVAATDDDAVARVEFRVAGGEAVVDDSPPFAIRIVTIAESQGTELPVVAEAFDAAGNSAQASTTVTVAGRTLTALTTDPADERHPAWSPDGTRIAFEAERNGAQFDLWVMDADGANPERLTANVNEDRNPAWSPDGTRIAFDSDRLGNFDIWLLPLAGGETAITEVTTGNNDDVEPAWSPDGSELWFASSRGTPADFDIYRQPVPGTEVDVVQVTAFDSDERAPAVRGDGEAVAFGSDLNFTLPHVYVRDLAEVGVEPLTGDPGVSEHDPAWLPDGDLVVFSRSSGTSATLWMQSPGGANPVQITFGGGPIGDGGAAWSPDGTRLAFHSDRAGNLDIWVME